MFIYWIVAALLIICYSCLFLVNVVKIKMGRFEKIFKSKFMRFLLVGIAQIIVIMFAIITLTFVLTYKMEKSYFIFNSNEREVAFLSKSFFEQLSNFYYRIIPFPKKVCISYDIQGSCNSYKNTLIDLSNSYTYVKNERVWNIIKEKCFVSFVVGMLAYLIEMIVGYFLGIISSFKKFKKVAHSISFLRFAISTIPPIIYFYLCAFISLVIFNLPIIFDFNSLKTYIAPLLAICFSSSLTVAYWVKKYMEIELEKDYVKLAKSKGLSDNVIFFKHVQRNALVPLMRTIPISIGACLCGFYLLEYAFNIPGVGMTLSIAISYQDIYLIQGLIIFFSFISVTSYFLSDCLYLLLNRHLKEGGNHE